MKVARILALLKHPEDVTLLKNCLEGVGKETEIVDSLEQGKRALSSRVFDLIISDFHLENGVDVFDFLRWTKSQARLKEIPFLLVSLGPPAIPQHLANEIRTTAQVLGATAYMSMDTFDAVRLRELLLEHLPGGAVLPAFWEISC